MKTLALTYGGASQDNPSFPTITFQTAFPQDYAKVAQTMKAKADALTDPFLIKWRTRVASWISDQLETTKGPDEIHAEMVWCTKDEYDEIIRIIDDYVPTDTSFEVGVLRVLDLGYFLGMMEQQANTLLMQMGMQREQQSRIITLNPNSGSRGGGQIITP